MYLELLIRLITESFAVFAFIALTAVSVLALVVISRLVDQGNRDK